NRGKKKYDPVHVSVSVRSMVQKLHAPSGIQLALVAILCGRAAAGLCCLWKAAQDQQMPRGDKSAYTGKQKRRARHIEEGYEERGVPEDEAERRAWATVNKETGGGNKSGSGRGVPDTNAASKSRGRRRGPRGGKGIRSPG